MNSPVSDAFRQLYTNTNMERDGLFAAMARAYRCETVLYPGCSIHINPSFHFRHVVYVDTSEAAQRFFAAAAEVQRVIDGRKRYAQGAHVEYLARDFTQALPLREASFDLLLALHAGGIARACLRYLRPGGILVSNNHQDDAGQAAGERGYRLVAVIHERQSQYVIDREGLDTYFVERPKPPADRAYMRESTRWPAYARNADYYVFRRTPVRSGC